MSYLGASGGDSCTFLAVSAGLRGYLWECLDPFGEYQGRFRGFSGGSGCFGGCLRELLGFQVISVGKRVSVAF